MRVRTRSVLTAAVTAGLLAATAAPALAAQHNGRCENNEMCLYYNSNLGGSFHDFSVKVPNFGTYKFISGGAGQGQYVKNNAASAVNNADVCNARVYFNSNYQGAYDEIKDDTWANLTATYNDNASFQWPGWLC